MRGRVLRDGEPVLNAAISFSNGAGNMLAGRIAATTSGESGFYEVGLEDPGDYTIRVRTTEIGGFGTTLRVDVPDQELYERDLMLPAGNLVLFFTQHPRRPETYFRHSSRTQ